MVLADSSSKGAFGQFGTRSRPTAVAGKVSFTSGSSSWMALIATSFIAYVREPAAQTILQTNGFHAP